MGIGGASAATKNIAWLDITNIFNWFLRWFRYPIVVSMRTHWSVGISWIWLWRYIVRMREMPASM